MRGSTVLLLCFSLVHANTIIAVMTFLFQQTNTKSLSYLINGNFCSIKHLPF